MKKLLIVMLAVVLVPAAAFAQQSGMRGEVTDNTGGILPGVTVEACSEALIEGCRVAITDGAGIYFITSLQAGIYSVTMSLPGFSTYVQEEIIVAAQFTQEVNGQLAVGGVEETITVTGESPIVDTVSSSRTETFTREIFDALPSTRNTETLGYLAQGVRIRNPDVGGLGGHNKIHSRGLTVHHTTAQLDGMQTDNADCDFCGGGKNLNPGYAAEFAMTTSSNNAETQTGGFRINLIPREGGNTQSGNAYIGFAGIHLQADNIDQNLISRGFGSGDKIVYNEEINPSWGGPILRDRLWFFSSVRFTKRYTAVANTEWPDSELMREFLPDLIGEQGISEGWGRSLGLRLTGQVTERMKVSAFFQRSFSLTGRGLTGWDWENVTLEPLEGSRHRNPDSQRPYLAQLKWTYTPSSRTLIELGYMTNNGGGTLSNQPDTPITRRLGAGRNLIPLPAPDDLIQCIVTPCFQPMSYDQTRPYFTDGVRRQDDTLRQRWGGDGWQWNMAFPKFTKIPQGSFSYVTGSHNFKTGFQAMSGRVGGQLTALGGFFDMAYRQGVPNNVNIANERLDSTWGTEYSFYAQDTWTKDRLTINLGIRNDNFNTGIDMWRAEGGIPASRFKHARIFDSAVIDEVRPRDWSPRFSIVYDLFGDAKTAVKFSANRYTKRYVTGLGARYHPVGWGWDWRPWADCSLLPSSKIPGGLQVFSGQTQNCPTQGMLMGEGFSQAEADFYLSTNADGIAQDHEIGRRGNLNVFTETPPTESPTRSGNRIDENLKREANVEYSASIQHEILPRVSVTFAYYYRTFFNVPKSVNAALPQCDPFLAVAGTQCGAYDTIPITFNDRFGVLPAYNGEVINVFNRRPEFENIVNDIVDSNTDRNGARYQAYELSFQARLPNGGTAFGGWTGHQHSQNSCALDNPNGGNITPMINGEWRFQQGGRFCNQIEPDKSVIPWAGMPFRHDFKFFAVYPLPYDFQVSGGVQIYSGDESQVMYQVQPGDFDASVTQTFSPTIVVNAPGEIYDEYWEQVDFNIRKHFRLRGVEYTAQIDVFNALNNNSILRGITTYSNVLFNPIQVIAGRVTKIAIQVNW